MTRFSHAPSRRVDGISRTRRHRRALPLGLPERLETRDVLSLVFGNALGAGAGTAGPVAVESTSVALDAAGDRFVSGSFAGTVDMGGAVLQSAGGRDAFLAEYAPDGHLVFARSAGGAGDDSAGGLALDASGNAYLTGDFQGPVDFGAGGRLDSGGGTGVFVWKVAPGGSTVFATAWAESGPGAVSPTIAVSAAGDEVAVGGSFAGSLSLGGTVLTAPAGVRDGFVARLDGRGGVLWGSQFVGAAGAESRIDRVALAANGNVLGAGRFRGAVDFDPAAGVDDRTSQGGSTDLAVVSLGGSDGGLVFADTAGGAGLDAATGVAAGPGGTVYATGTYQQSWNVSAGGTTAALAAPAGATGDFLLALKADGGLVFADDLGASTAGLSGTQAGEPAVAVNAQGTVAVATAFTGTAEVGRYTLRGTDSPHTLVATFDGSGRPVQAAAVGGEANTPSGVALGDDGRVAVAGNFSGFVTFGGFGVIDRYHTDVPNADAFVATLHPVAGVANDFFGEARSEAYVYNPATAVWTVRGPAGATTLGAFGSPGDVPAPGDYQRFGHTQPAVYRPSTAQWIVSGLHGAEVVATLGAPGDVPVPGDYDGVGYTEPAVFRPSTAEWIVLGPNGVHTLGTFGTPNSNDVPVPGDYDGTGHTEMAVFHPATGQWFADGPNGGHLLGTFGDPNQADVPVPGDYDRVGHTELAVFRASTSEWRVLGPNGVRTASILGASLPNAVPDVGLNLAARVVTASNPTPTPTPITVQALPTVIHGKRAAVRHTPAAPHVISRHPAPHRRHPGH